MKTPAENQFDTLESAYQYIGVLTDVLEETRIDVNDEVELAENAGAARRIDALQLAAYKLERLRHHLDDSRRVLNDLRMLRRILQGDLPGDHDPVSYNQGDAFARDPQ
jgi:hypothetical protein